MASGRRDVDDYSFSRPAMGALARGVMRYLYANGKGLTASEVSTLRGAGKILGLNYEAGAGDFTGAAAGRAHAVAAAGLAARLPVAKAPIIFSADWPVAVAQFRAVGDALEAAAGVLGWGWVGLYGHAGLMDYVNQRFGSSVYRWQTYAWSGGRLSTAADLYQFLNGQNVAGGQVDYNQIVGRNFLTALGGQTPQSGQAAPIAPPTTTDIDELEQIMSWYGSRAEFEQAMTDCAKAGSTVSDRSEGLTNAANLSRRDNPVPPYTGGEEIAKIVAEVGTQNAIVMGYAGAADVAKGLAVTLNAGVDVNDLATKVAAQVNRDQAQAFLTALSAKLTA